MKNWFKNLSKESIQRIVFFGLLAVLFVAFFISLQLVDTETASYWSSNNNDNNL